MFIGFYYHQMLSTSPCGLSPCTFNLHQMYTTLQV